MATYESIHGTRVRYLTSDPTLDSSTEGQVWYNSTEGANKALVQVKAWSSGGNMGTARYALASATSATQDAALAFGGAVEPSPLHMTNTEEYNGINWSPGGSLSTARRRLAGAGTQTAGLAFGGAIAPVNTPTNATEAYNGSSWTNGGNMGTSRFALAGAGTQTAGLAFGGDGGTATEEYNGSSWTAGGALNTGRSNLGGMGTQTAALGMGGYGPGALSFTESYNGTSWTALSATDLGRYNAAAAGTQTLGIFFGGFGATALLSATSEWDGTNWSTSPATMSAPKANIGGAGTFTAAISFGGSPPGAGNTATEEYNSNINAITQAAWAAGGTQNTSRVYSGGSGPVNSALIINGFTGSGLGGFNDAAETYNGTSWSNITNFPYNAVGTFGLGDSEAFIGGAGYKNDATHVNTTAEWSGSSWTSGGNVNEVGQAAGGTGTQTAGIIGNRSTSPSAQAEEYDGSSWTSTPNTNVAGAGGNGMAGTQTAALMYGASPTPLYDRTESWNGSAWTSVNALSTGRRSGSMGGSQTAALFGGGNINPPTSNTTQTELYNGTSWVTSANMATARFYQRGGSHTAADSQLASSGSPNGSAISAATEEFTAGTSVTTASTLTTS